MTLEKNKSVKRSESKPRITSQQRIIIDYLKGVTIHPSAEKIYIEVKKKLPQISMGTVYRNLNMLKEKGDILEISTKMARYDGDTSVHSHFICDVCGAIFDIFDSELKKVFFLERKKNDDFKFGKVKSHQLYLYGVCKKCEK